jgi:hypothetical protein
MAAFAWVMMGIALWHFAIFIPDRFWGGIVGAFLAAVVGALAFGFIVSGFTIPGQNDTSVLTALEAIPGTLAAMGLLWLEGARRGIEPLEL